MTTPMTPAAETLARIEAVAVEEAAKHAVTINTWANGQCKEKIDWTFAPKVQRCDGSVYVWVPENAVLDREASRAMLIAVHDAIATRLRDEGIAWTQRVQNTRNGRTWVHTTGYEHMQHFCTTGRQMILRAKAA